jgi:hypothetical protein
MSKPRRPRLLFARIEPGVVVVMTVRGDGPARWVRTTGFDAGDALAALPFGELG